MKRLFIIIVTLLLQYSYIAAQEDPSPSNTYHLVTESKYVDDGVYLIGGYQVEKSLFLMNTKNMHTETESVIEPMEINPCETIPKTITLSDTDTQTYPLLSTLEFEIKRVDDGYHIMQGGKYLCSKTSKTMSFEDTYTQSGVWSINDQDTRTYYRCKISIGKTSFLYFSKPTKSMNAYFCISSSTSTLIAPNLYRKDPTITIGATGYATYYNGSWDSTLPEGVTAYTLKLNTNVENSSLVQSHKYVSGDKIPAGCAVLIKGSEPASYTFSLSTPDTTLPKYENALCGTDSETTITSSDKDFYILSLDENNDINSIGFYTKNDDTDSFINNPHKAYLPIDKSVGAKRLTFCLDPTDNDVAGISPLLPQHGKDVILHDVTGKRNYLQKQRIVIRNGKKYIE